jgi:hypothetical protein
MNRHGMKACIECGMASENETLHKNDCPVIVGPRIPAPLFADIARAMLDKGFLNHEAKETRAIVWLAEYDAWKKARGG